MKMIKKWMIYFFYNRNRTGLLSFQGFCEYYLVLIQNKIYSFRDYYSLIYNNLLEYIINNIEEFDINSNNIVSNLYKILKQKIYKLSLFNNIDKQLIQYFFLI